MNTVIFDFGGVLVDWDPWALYKKVFENKGEFEKFLGDSRFYEWIERSDHGVRFDDIFEQINASAPHCVEHARIFQSRFMETIVGFQSGTVRVVEDLKNLQVPLYGLTNWSAETFPPARDSHNVFTHFEDIIVSGVEKIAKPDPKIFELAVSRWNLSPQQTVFIDDRTENVEAARRIGMTGIVYQNSHDLRRELENYFPALKKVSTHA